MTIVNLSIKSDQLSKRINHYKKELVQLNKPTKGNYEI